MSWRATASRCKIRIATGPLIRAGDSRGSEIHNEILHDESAAFAIERKYPESNHAPVVATFDV